MMLRKYILEIYFSHLVYLRRFKLNHCSWGGGHFTNALDESAKYHHAEYESC